ncbi:probable DNA-3-methyladenine glycosylase [Anoplophora glabripennis]|uniref:probable DNA-3-methyladenine glycosylase n=1 Tax=Anoplophora glabripennis TaxID=217634 RepID=UPI000874E328|nr:probable DNA-3-methyladenine glycosylase [Anoplophora glabripennis]
MITKMSLEKSNCRRLLKEDLDKPCKELAMYLLGKILVRKLEDDKILKGRIVETESYLGGEDKGSHSYSGRRTQANEPMYMPAGTAYVYMTYGMYHCFNISSKEPGAAVLLRALEPISGIETMQKFRVRKVKSIQNEIKTTKLCDGPSKLCISMNITKQNLNKIDLTDLKNDKMWLEDDPDIDKEIRIVHTSRIGIASAGVEWTIKPLRFYILNNDSISKRDKAAEEELDFDIH